MTMTNTIKRTTVGIAAAIIAVTATFSATSINADAALTYRTKTISASDTEEISYMLDLIGNQRQFTNSAGRNTRSMIEYLLYDSDYAVFGGKAFPVANTYGSSASSIRDSGLDSIYGTDKMPLDTKSRGCMAYGWFASGTVYGSDYSLKSSRWYVPSEAGSYTVDQMRNFCKSNLQAGEHFRVSGLHSMTFISCDDYGVYYFEYPTSNDRDPYIKLSYSDWNTYVRRINQDNASVYVYEVHSDHIDGQNSKASTESTKKPMPKIDVTDSMVWRTADITCEGDVTSLELKFIDTSTHAELANEVYNGSHVFIPLPKGRYALCVRAKLKNGSYSGYSTYTFC